MKTTSQKVVTEILGEEIYASKGKIPHCLLPLTKGKKERKGHLSLSLFKKNKVELFILKIYTSL